MLAFVVVCALGLLGRGPPQRAHPLQPRRVDRDPLRAGGPFGAPTIVRLDTRVPPGGDQVAVTIAKELVDLFGLESITPRPQTWQVAGGNIRLVFPVIKGETHA